MFTATKTIPKARILHPTRMILQKRRRLRQLAGGRVSRRGRATRGVGGGCSTRVIFGGRLGIPRCFPVPLTAARWSLIARSKASLFLSRSGRPCIMSSPPHQREKYSPCLTCPIVPYRLAAHGHVATVLVLASLKYELYGL